MVVMHPAAKVGRSGSAPDRIRLPSKLHPTPSRLAVEAGADPSPNPDPTPVQKLRTRSPRGPATEPPKARAGHRKPIHPPAACHSGGRRRLSPPQACRTSVSKAVPKTTSGGVPTGTAVPGGPAKAARRLMTVVSSEPAWPCQANPPRAEVAAPKDFRTTDAQRAVYAYLKTIAPLPELQEPRVGRVYAEASIKDTLYPIVEAYDVIIVAGAYFGDEGKGKTVEAVSRHPKCTCIARVNSGENAGHTVFDSQGRKFVFNLLPSGILSEGARSYIGPECIMDPISFMESEVQQLINAGLPYLQRVRVGNVYIVTPYHKLLDLVLSEANSSTLKGMSPAHAGKVSKNGIRLNHIFNDEATLRSQLKRGLEVYFGMLKQKNMTEEDVAQRCAEANSGTLKRVPSHVINFIMAKDKLEYLVDLYRTRVRENTAFPARCDVVQEMAAAVRRGEKVLLEGPQSYWLSNGCDKFWVSSTSSNTSAIGLLAASQLNFQSVKAVVINVHKAPASSRVGIGACPSGFVAQDFFSSRNIRTLDELPKGICADFDAIQTLFFNYAFPHANDPDRFNGISEPIEYSDATGTYNIGAAMAIASSVYHGELGAVTRKPRICGFFDCVLHHEVNMTQGPYLTISALDRGDAYDRLGITIAYVYYSPQGVICDSNGRQYRNGDIIRAGDSVPSENVLYYCYPIVKLVNGWKDTPIASTKREKGAPFPPALCEFLSTIEHFTGCKVLSIGNGPGGDDIIYINQS